jgi:hypothetical protein
MTNQILPLPAHTTGKLHLHKCNISGEFGKRVKNGLIIILPVVSKPFALHDANICVRMHLGCSNNNNNNNKKKTFSLVALHFYHMGVRRLYDDNNNTIRRTGDFCGETLFVVGIRSNARVIRNLYNCTYTNVHAVLVFIILRANSGVR